MSQVSLGRPEFVPGTPPGHPTAKFLHVMFLYRFFLSLVMVGPVAVNCSQTVSSGIVFFSCHVIVLVQRASLRLPCAYALNYHAA